MKNIFRILAILGSLLISCTPEENGSNENGNGANKELAVNVVTGEATDITPNSSKLSAMCTISNAKASEGVTCFYYSTLSGESADIKASGHKVDAGSISNRGDSFSASLVDLEPSTKYYYTASVTIDGKEFFGKVKTFTTQEDPLKIEVTTGDATSIDPTSAKLNAACTIDGAKSPNGTASFYYSTASGDASEIKGSGNKLNAGKISSPGGSFSITASGFESATTYYYVASIYIDGREFFGKVKSFATADKAKDPTVTGSASEITEISATLSGYANPTLDMGTVTFGIIYSTESVPTLENSIRLVADDMDGEHMFAVKATNLSSNTTYYFRSHMHTQYGGDDYFGEVRSFTTLTIPAEVTTIEATEIGLFCATISGSLKDENTAELEKNVWFYLGEASDLETLKSNGIKLSEELQEDGTFTHKQTQLKYNCTYYYVACAKVHDKEFYGEVKSFTTGGNPPEVTTGSATEIGLYTVTLNGSLSMKTTESLRKYVGFCLGTSSDLQSLLSSGSNYGVRLNSDGTFSGCLASLDKNQKYFYVAYALVYDNYAYKEYFYGDVNSFSTADVSATVVTADALDVEYVHATIGGALTVNNTEELSKEVWLLYSDSVNSLEALKTDGIKIKVSLKDDNTFSKRSGDFYVGTKYYYVACAKVHDKEFYGEVKSFTTKSRSVPDGAVELGLSVMWATHNVGATTPEEYGGHYPWGETERQCINGWSNYKWCEGTQNTLTKYCTNSQYGIVDNKNVLDLEDDVAHVKWGGNWRMPTYDEMKELYSKCTWSLITQNGVQGYLVTSKKNNNSIFLPLAGLAGGNNQGAGYYWTSSVSARSYEAYHLLISNSVSTSVSSRSRDWGLSVRPVIEE